MASEGLREFVLEQLESIDVRCRAMSGGHGCYLDGVFFGVIFDERLYFRTDEASRPA